MPSAIHLMKRYGVILLFLAALASTRAARADDPTPVARRAVRVALRLGGAGGTGSNNQAGGVLLALDITIPSAGLSPKMNGRVDIDNWAFSLFGQRSGGTAVTLCQVSNGSPAYVGVGIGYTRLESNSHSRAGIGGKLIAGVNISSFLGIEGNLHFSGPGTVVAGMLRVRF